MVEFDHVSKVYADGTVAINDLSLTVEKGEFVVLIGPSGCGKTTSLKMINRLEDPTSGTIRINGKDIQTVDPVKLRRGIGYVIQETGLMPHLTIEENIAMVLHLHKWSKKRIYDRVSYLLELAGLSPSIYRYRLPSQLSGGQRQRIGVLRALAAEPDVVLMDEPFGALDPISRDKLQNELLDLQRKLHKTIIFVTHDIDEALKLSDRVVLLRKGKIEQVAPPLELQASPKNEFVQNFIGEDRLSQISPETGVETLVEEAPLVCAPSTESLSALEQMEEAGRETAQIVDGKGVWRGMLRLSDVKKAVPAGQKVAKIVRTDRKLYIEEATIRDAAEMLSDEDIPIPIIDEQSKFHGLITTGGIARLTVSRLTRSRHAEAAKTAHGTELEKEAAHGK